ncbi:hypothetical protein V2A60_009327 [Cordyceps javanica]
MAVQNIHLGWEATNVPDSGLEDITFPMAMPNAPREEGYYFEQAVAFENVPEGMDPTLVIYTGLQPRPDKNGKSIVHAAFSSFFPGTTTSDSNCYDTADGGPGVSCAIDVQSSYEDTYHLHIKVANQTSYIGTLINHSSGKRWPMGSFDLPTGVSGMKGGDWLGFMEYYFTTIGDCSKYPDTAAIFGNPFTSTTGVNMSLTYPYKDNACDDTMPWHVTEIDQSTLEITIGKNTTSDEATSKQPTSTTATEAGTTVSASHSSKNEPTPSEKPTSTTATDAGTTISVSHSSKNEPTPTPGWNGPAPNLDWDGPAPNPDWDGPAPNPDWDGPAPNPDWD